MGGKRQEVTLSGVWAKGHGGVNNERFGVRTPGSGLDVTMTPPCGRKSWLERMC